VLRQNGIPFSRYGDPKRAVDEAARGDGILILADGYPASLTQIPSEVYAGARGKGLRLYVEYPDVALGLVSGTVRRAQWERAVVSSEAFGPSLPSLRILMIHGCHLVHLTAPNPHLVLARVAGFDDACYGLPPEAAPLLAEHPHADVLIAATKLSQFVTARYAPSEAWGVVWRWILGWVSGGREIPPVRVAPTVYPSFDVRTELPPDAERRALRRGATWYLGAKLFIHCEWRAEAQRRLDEFHDGTGPGPEPDWPVGDGRWGMLEGASSRVYPDGSQDWRYHVRADCVGEASMAMAFAGKLFEDDRARRIAANLNEYIYERSIFAQGPRAQPNSPSYGLLSWSTQPPADGVYYGDDNARSMLGTMAAGSLLETDRWDTSLLCCLLANLRTTGPQGFRGARLEEADLQESGWRHYWETPRTHFAPHYESWLWACFLWAYKQTGFKPFLDRASTAIQMTMAAYPDAWRWTNGIQQERARMLLPLAWLVRLVDTPQHRGWLRRIASELLDLQDACGAIREEVGSAGLGAYGPPTSNEAYGTTEATLIQQNGDPLCDLLYTSNFAFFGLHEAAAATGEAIYAEASDALAQFLCRIQISSIAHPELDGGWFRAFDYRRWEYWASNADAGWGAWSIESGWTQAWITAVLALRQMHTSFWDLTARSRIALQLDDLLPVMFAAADAR
jgi:hypothetical protein